MSILDNAKDSIIMGLEDYSSGESRRLISCTRNLFAGILLLFKHKLNSLSPKNSNEALIKQKVEPVLDSDGNLIWVGQGKKTLDVRQIKERFDSIGISVDWKKVESINKFRNDIEHYYSKLSKSAMRDTISDTFLIVRDFLTLNLQLDPKDFLGEEEWNTLISVSEVYNREKNDCVKTFNNVEWISDGLYASLIEFKCDECGSDLICINAPQEDRNENIFTCKSCGREWDFEEIAIDSIEKYYSFENYLSYTDGDESATLTCPECFHETYIYHEQSCAFCGYSAEHECQRCSIDIPSCEIDGSGFCSWCQKMMSNDD